MAKYLEWAVVVFGVGGIVNNFVTASIPIVSDIGDLTLSGFIMLVGLWGYL